MWPRLGHSAEKVEAPFPGNLRSCILNRLDGHLAICNFPFEGNSMPLSPEDRLQIIDLVGRYSLASDHRDAEEWLALFTPDAKLVANGKTLCEGQESFTSYVSKWSSSEPTRRHWTSNIVVD